MTPDTETLANTVREAIHTLTDASFGDLDEAAMHENSLNGYAALDALVVQANGWRAIAEDADGNLFVSRAETAEARVKELEQQLAEAGSVIESWRRDYRDATTLLRVAQDQAKRVLAAEAERDELLDERFRYVQAVAAAEARADRLQEALLEIEQTATADRDIALSEFVQRKLREAGA